MNQCWTSLVNLKSDENNFYLPRICFASPSIKRTARAASGRFSSLHFPFAVWATYVPLAIAQLETGRNFHTQGFVGRPRHLSDDWISIIRHQSTSRNGNRLHLTDTILAECFSIKTIFFQWITWQSSLDGDPATNNSRQRRKRRKSCAQREQSNVEARIKQ